MWLALSAEVAVEMRSLSSTERYLEEVERVYFARLEWKRQYMREWDRVRDACGLRDMDQKRAFMREYSKRPEVVARRKALEQTPEYKAKNRARSLAWAAKPENKARRRESYRMKMGAGRAAQAK